VVHPFAAFQSRYDLARAALRTTADIARVVVEAAADDAADGAGWLELQVDPTSYASRLGGLEAVVEAVLAGAAAAPIPVGVIVAASWGATPEHALRLAQLAVAYPGVVGFGISNDERLGTVSSFVPAARLASEAGLLVTPHGGFYEGPAHVRDCVEVLGARRVGHGLRAVEDPATLELLASRSVALEVCPTSYPPFGGPALEDLPLGVLREAGVPVALASDDPLLFGTSLAGQYAIARDAVGLTDAQLAALARDSVTASAAPPDVAAALLAGIPTWLA
jgi:adenosine deaminase